MSRACKEEEREPVSWTDRYTEQRGVLKENEREVKWSKNEVKMRKRLEGREREKGKGRFKKDVEEMRRRELGRRLMKVERKRRRNEEVKS